MAETKRYDVGGKTIAGRTYPSDAVLKLTKEQAAGLGLSDADVSDMKTTADDATIALSYAETMENVEKMREGETERANALAEKQAERASVTTTSLGGGLLSSSSSGDQGSTPAGDGTSSGDDAGSGSSSSTPTY